MAVVLKAPVGNSKGVVVFTHKERHWLEPHDPALVSALEQLRQRYFVCMHWGFHHENVTPAAVVDLHIARESAVTFDRPVRRLAMNSAMFTPRDFRPRSLHKQWDVISVTRTSRFKRTDQLLETLRRARDLKPDLSAFVLCVGRREVRARDHADLWERYVSLFSPSERERISFVLLLGDFLFPVARRDIAFLYNSARVFTLFSEYEGESRVIKEALLCGLPVLLRETLRGGGLDFLDASNSRLFSGVDDAAERLVEMLDGISGFEVDATALAEEISETHSVPRFRSALEALFAEHGVPFEGALDVEDLSRKLPSHVQNLPRELCLPLSDDLRSTAATLQFVRGLIGDDRAVSAAERLSLGLHTRLVRMRRLARAARLKVGGAVRQG